MADLETYYSGQGSDGDKEQPGLLGDGDCRRWSSDCTCSVCKSKGARRSMESKFEDYNDIVPSRREELTRHHYLLCPDDMHSFVFKLRVWG